ncbi:hypothetical protein FRC11_003409, partial [Ceratobasidium sp. 423]
YDPGQLTARGARDDATYHAPSPVPPPSKEYPTDLLKLLNHFKDKFQQKTWRGTDDLKHVVPAETRRALV